MFFHEIFIVFSLYTTNLMKTLLTNKGEKYKPKEISRWVNDCVNDGYYNTALHVAIANEQQERALRFLELTRQNKILIHPSVDIKKQTQLVLSAKTYQEKIALKILECMQE